MPHARHNPRAALLETFPSARFVAKSDDDVFVHTPSIELHLRAIRHSESAYYGHPGFFSLMASSVDGAVTSLEVAGYSPSYHYALMVQRTRGLRSRCNSTANASVGRSCTLTGPFPFMCGQLVALSSALAARLLASDGLQAEAAAIASLPESNELLTEDAWLGSALFRCV